MEYVLLGIDGPSCSRIGLRCSAEEEWLLNGRIDRQYLWNAAYAGPLARAIEEALDHGVNFLDTCPSYGCGHSERIVGRALAGRRDKLVLSTKCGMILDETTNRIVGTCSTPEFLRHSCEESLRRLRTDRIDLFVIYGGLVLDRDGVVGCFEQLVDQGKIRSYGFYKQPNAVLDRLSLNIRCWSLQGTTHFIRMYDMLSNHAVHRLVIALESPAQDLSQESREGLNVEELSFLGGLGSEESIRSIFGDQGRSLGEGLRRMLLDLHEHAIFLVRFVDREQYIQMMRAAESPRITSDDLERLRSLISV
ncbi:MAG TPA: aldo/keto reductase [Bryobacteraceae bacterium]|jgi:hypothetical protein|nr:aldo/keto reductase [Bryobacteraceae bacterium]